MKSSICLVLLAWCSLLSRVAGFDAQDHEIFRLRDEIAASEGPEVTFYDFLGVSPSASQDEIQKASRRRSKQLHPDKVKQSFIAARATATRKPKLGKAKNKKAPGVTVNKPPSQSEIQREVDLANQRYKRLSVISTILKGEGRERYDYFLANGFPAWRGTGYYYARFRPGLGTVLVGLFVVGGGAAHYGAMYLSWKRQRDFVERYIRHARKSAWGDESAIRAIPGIDGGSTLGSSTGSSTPPTSSSASFAQENGAAVLNRRQKRAQDKEAKKEEKKGKRLGGVNNSNSGTSTPVNESSDPLAPQAAAPPLPSGPQGAKKRVQAENGKILIVDSFGHVFLEEEVNEDEDDDSNGKTTTRQFLLDPNEIPRPTVYDTVLFRLPVWLYGTVVQRVTGNGNGAKGRRLGDADPNASDDGPDVTAGEEEEEESPSERGDTASKRRKYHQVENGNANGNTNASVPINSNNSKRSTKKRSP